MSQAEYTTWLLLCTQELDWLRKLSRMNITLLARGRDMDYPELISFLERYNLSLNSLKECADTREEWQKRDLAPCLPALQSMLERRRARVWRQQERVSPMLDRIVAECPQQVPRLALDASGRFSVV